MTNIEYEARKLFLRAVLADALERGDYNLEMDATDLLLKLDEEYNNDN